MRNYRRMILHKMAGDADASSEAAGIAEMLGDVGIGGGASSSSKVEKVSKEDLIDDADDVEYDEAESSGDDESDEIDTDEEDEEDSDESEESAEDADEDGDDKVDSQERLLRILENLTRKQEDADESPESDEDEDPFQGESFTAMVDALALDSDGANVLKTFMQRMLAVDRKQTVRDIMRELPKVTEQTVSAKQKQEALRTAFYEDNPQLKPVQGYVSAIAKEVASDPRFNKDVKSILAETAKRSYAALGLKKGKVKSTQLPERGKRKPAFPNSNHSRKKTEKPSKLRSEIDAMLNAL